MAARVHLLLLLLTVAAGWERRAVGAGATAGQRGSLLCPSKDNGRTVSSFRYEDCSSLGEVKGQHAIDRVGGFCFSQFLQGDRVAVRFQWTPGPLGIEYIRGFKIILQEAKSIGAEKTCQALVLEEKNQLKYFNKTLVLKSHLFRSLKFNTQYNVTILPFPNLLDANNTFQFEVECWSPKNLDVNQPYLSPHGNVTFDLAPSIFGFKAYHIRCKMNSGFQKEKNIFVVTDSSNATGKQVNFTIRPVLFPWAGPLRAMAITVPLVVVSAIITLFTIVCCKKQQNPVYSELDEENSESSPSPRTRAKVFICYSSKDCQKHLAVVQCFAAFLQDFCGCEVALDLWEQLEICKEGQTAWLSRQIMESHYVIVICSKGMKFFVEKKQHKHRGRCREGELFLLAVSMVAERLRQARLQAGNPSRFIAVYFDYSCEGDIPGALDLACKYKLMDHFPQLHCHLHARDVRQPDSDTDADTDTEQANLRKSNYFHTRSGRSLYMAISNMKQLIELEPNWFEKQLLMPGLLPLPLPPRQARPRTDSGLVLNEVVFKQQLTHQDFHLKTRADITPTNSVSYSIIQHLDVREDGDDSDPREARALLRPAPHTLAVVTLPEMPRDSGIYDSSIPSSELSLPLMEGLSSDQADTGSMADSVSTSSGLGEDDPPALATKAAVPGLCKLEVDSHVHGAVTL
ncbi:interleukin-17 receptor D [Leucoraja erinacea]|uniref:interleukin-17 receptor D n=1 Tax=Leucoraja erinaceus TaxID=7782 RepID=UPI002458756F|nr:interleukin-17 receptor D [Leucoraja erinacea]